MPKRYPRELRRSVCERLVAAEKVSSLSKSLGVSEGTPYLWKRQALIDAGRAEGIKSFEADELAQATLDAVGSSLHFRRHRGRDRQSPRPCPGRGVRRAPPIA